MKKFKEHQKRFRKWQEKPFDYEFATDETQHCDNCGHDFKGNYCPYCSQKAGEGPIGWGSVRRSIMDVWGLGSHSLPNTLWQLLLRPGHLISDYISGKRQVSFPPVKMLFIVSLIIVFWIYYLMPILMGGSYDVYGGNANMFHGFTEWNKGHFVWTYFIMAVIYIVPTWVMYRYAPRHTRHTMPQGFFIQIFLLVLNLVVSFIVLSPFAFWDYNYYLYISVFVLLVYYTIAYKQLFGYGIWGTLWRFVFVFGATIYMISALVFLAFEVEPGVMEELPVAPENLKYYYAGDSAFYAVLILLVGWIINMIATRKARKCNNSSTNR